MHTASFTGTSLFGLFRSLKENIKELAREELALAKKEMTDKLASYRTHAVTLVIGGIVAYSGLILLLAGLGLLAAYGLQHAGLDPLLAEFIGLAGVGFVVILIGGIMALAAVKAFSSESLAPEKTLHTIRHLKGTDTGPKMPKEKIVPNRSAEQMHTQVIATEERIGRTLEEIAYRTSPVRIKARADAQIRAHPYRSSIFALGSGLLGGVLLTRRLRG